MDYGTYTYYKIRLCFWSIISLRKRFYKSSEVLWHCWLICFFCYSGSSRPTAGSRRQLAITVVRDVLQLLWWASLLFPFFDSFSSMAVYGPITEAAARCNARLDAELAAVQAKSQLLTERRVAMVAPSLPFDVRRTISSFAYAGYGFISAQRREAIRQSR